MRKIKMAICNDQADCQLNMYKGTDLVICPVGMSIIIHTQWPFWGLVSLYLSTPNH